MRTFKHTYTYHLCIFTYVYMYLSYTHTSTHEPIPKHTPTHIYSYLPEHAIYTHIYTDHAPHAQLHMPSTHTHNPKAQWCIHFSLLTKHNLPLLMLFLLPKIPFLIISTNWNPTYSFPGATAVNSPGLVPILRASSLLEGRSQSSMGIKWVHCGAGHTRRMLLKQSFLLRKGAKDDSNRKGIPARSWPAAL